jgi:hypothetical protein
MVVLGHRGGLRRHGHGRVGWENLHPSLRPGKGAGIVVGGAGGLLLAACAGWGAERPPASETTL